MSGIQRIPPYATPPTTIPPEQHSGSVDPPSKEEKLDSASTPQIPPIHIESHLSPPPSSSPPTAPRRRYELLNFDPLASREIQKPSSGSGDRYKQASSSTEVAVAEVESIPSPLTGPALHLPLLSRKSPLNESDLSPHPRIPQLNLSFLPSAPEPHKAEPIDPSDKHTPIRETPGDISGRYYPEPQSVRFVTNQSPSPSHHKKPSPAPYLFTHLRRANTPFTLHPHFSSSKSSSSSSSLSPRPFEGAFAEVHLITDTKKKFLEDIAAKAIAIQLVQEGDREENIESVLAVLLPYQKMQKKRQIEQRWNLLLTAILLRLECVDLNFAFLQRSEMIPQDFAAIVTSGFVYKKIPPMEVVHIISMYTQKDLEKEVPDETLFRANTLSSALLSSYGHYLLTDFPKTNFLKGLEKTIERHWRKKAPELLYLNYQRIHEGLLKNQKGFDKLSIPEQNKLCAEIIQRNRDPCQEFFFAFLSYFYKQPLPAACQDLFGIRRNQIYHFLRAKTPPLYAEQIQELALKTGLSVERIQELASCSTEEALRLFPSAENVLTLIQQEKNAKAQRDSAKWIGGDLFLRIINPYLVTISNEPSKQYCLKGLGKMIQTLSNQTPPQLPQPKENLREETEKEKEARICEEICQHSEEILFHELYLAFTNIHQKYLNKNFPIRFSPSRDEDIAQNV